MPFCLLPKYRDAFREALKNGEITPDKLNAMTTAERTAFFAERFGGEANGKAIERALEMKHLNKNVEVGMVRWAERLIDVPNDYKTDLVSRIRKMSQEGGLLDTKGRESLLDEVVEYRTGKKISPDEAKTITEMSARLAEAEKKWKDSGAKDEAARTRYGSELAAYQRYVDSLESASKKRDYVTFMREEGLLGKTGGAMRDIGNAALKVGEVMRVLKTGADNSFFGRQFRKAWRPGTAKMTLENYGQSWVDIYNTMKGGKAKGDAILDAVKADVWSRENALKGRYSSKEGKLDIGLGEEAYPDTFLEKIPGVGRVFTASRTAAEGSAMRLRADIADYLYELAEKQGRDLDNPVEVGAINRVVNSMTGRGHLKMGAETGRIINATLFSAKHAKSTLDTFTQPLTEKTSFARKQALWNTLGFAATTAMIQGMASVLVPGSVETDPRSTDFGQIKIGDTRYDITGGSKAWAVLASRLFTKETKSSVTGQVKELGGFGMPDSVDLLTNFAENKTSPLARLGLDLLKGETFEGKPMTVNEAAKSLFLPIIVQTGKEAVEADGVAHGIAATIADMNGIGVNTYLYNDDWSQKTSKEMVGFRKKVGEKKFNDANEEYNKAIQKTLNSTEYEKADNENKQKILDKAKVKAKKDVMFKSGFKP